MNCTLCGHQNINDARFCVSCGHPLRDVDTTHRDSIGQETEQPSPFSQPGNQPQQFSPPSTASGPNDIPNYLVQAILATICCCLPAGIVSIVYAAQVNGKVERGDIASAREYSDNARKWAWISFGTGIVVIIISGIVSLI